MDTLLRDFRAAAPAVDFCALRFVEESSEYLAVRQDVAEPPQLSTSRGAMVTVIDQPALLPHRIPGIRVAGKTGTADFPTDLGYTSGKTFASIVALMPADKPKLAILIRLDAPEAMYGGTAAAPVLKRVGSELAAYYRIPANANGR